MLSRFNSKAQAQIIIGQKENYISYTKKLLQSLLCKKNGCSTCITCKQIESNRHEKILWLVPEKAYTLDDIEIVFNKISFTLDDNEQFFIIFEKADFLGTNCSNKLLKSIEEPKKGYYFILLAQRENLILPTVISRCSITYLQTNNIDTHLNEFLMFFLDIEKHDATTFLKIVR